jgi:hypothetical protein
VRTRLILAAVCILALPLWFSASPGDRPISSAPFATVAYAGHTTGGNAPCMCGCPDCDCDPGQENHKCSQSARPVSDGVSFQGASPIREHLGSGFDFGTGALMLALALFVWARLRA